MHAEGDVPLQQPVPRLAQRALGGQGHYLVQSEGRLECTGQAVEEVGRRRGLGHGDAQSTMAAPPDAAALARSDSREQIVA
jgi:hypothetical protein